MDRRDFFSLGGRRRIILLATLALLSLLAPQISCAQFTTSFQTNIISGVFSNWTGDYNVGNNTVFDQLGIISGGVLSNNGYGEIGLSSSANNNSALVTGPSSLWNNTNTLFVGDAGSSNSLTVGNGGRVVDTYGYIGNDVASRNNFALVTDLGSVWSNSQNLYVGITGSGNRLTITNGGQVVSLAGVIGFGSSNNTALVTGAGSLWINSADFNVGGSGVGNSVTVADGGQVFSAYGFISKDSVSNSVLVTGSGSVWSNGNDLYVGFNIGGGSLVISNGGSVYDYTTQVGYNNSSSNNTVLVSGTGSVLHNAAPIDVGFTGSGNRLIVANGGAVYSGDGYVGNYPSASNNMVSVSGTGSVWSTDNNISVGDQDVSGNQLIIANGGAVYNDADGFLGRGSGSNNTVLVNGPGSIWNPGGDLYVGNSGAGNQLIITEGGKEAVGGRIVVAPDNSVTLNGGNLIAANGLEIRNNATLTGCGTINGSVVVDPGGTVITDCGGILTFTGIVTNNGTMQAINGGVLEAYGTVVNNGTIDITDGTTNFHGAFINNGTIIGGATTNCTPGAVWTEATAATPWSARNNFAAVAYNGRMWVLGGQGSSNDFNDVWSSSDGTNWSEATPAAQWSVRADSAAVVDSGQMRVIGGDSDCCGLNDVWSSSDGTNWTQVTNAAQWCPRGAFGAVAFNGRIWVYGGDGCLPSDVWSSGCGNSVAPPFQITAITKQGNDIRVTWNCEGGQSYFLQSTKAAAIAGYTTNFANISPVIVVSGVGVSTTNYLDPGVVYAPILPAPSGNNVSTSVVPSTVSISADNTRGITDSLGRALPIGSLLMLGSFSISEPAIQSNFFANNVAAIMSNFTLYATSFKVGDGTSLPASWSVMRSAAGFDGKQIYLLAIDKPTFAAATHLGIFTAPSWVFPSSGGTNSIDLADVTDFVLGAQSGPLTINLPLGGETYTFDDTARLNVLPGRILFYRVRLAP
jgi:T5SS/PEP-CTERM-associated repeat protein